MSFMLRARSGKNKTKTNTYTRAHAVKQEHASSRHTDTRIDVKGGARLHVHPHAYTGKIKEENRHLKLTDTYSR